MALLSYPKLLLPNLALAQGSLPLQHPSHSPAHILSILVTVSPQDPCHIPTHLLRAQITSSGAPLPGKKLPSS